MSTVTAGARTARIEQLLERRTQASSRFFARESDRVARLCHALAERFARGGRLVSLAGTPASCSDARHVAVEFVHPVIVGKRALPALSLVSPGGGLAEQLRALAEPDDIVVAYGGERGDDRDLAAALGLAAERGCLTVSFGGASAEWRFKSPDPDPFVAQEVVETLYHVLWELVHVFFEHPGLLGGAESAPAHDPGASSFLYPFLSRSEHDLEAVLADVARSALMKAEEVGRLREQTLAEGCEELCRVAEELRRRFEAGAKLLAFGNGGSATDAMDLVADLRQAPAGAGDGAAARWPSRAAIDLTEDPSILTAIGNDIGVEELFQRQVIAYGREGDAAVAFSTSGGSENLLEALAEARRRRILTIAFVGYDGGRIAAEGLADHVIVSRSQHIPRIQEAQASAYHVLRELLELA